jgi:hypothetical protein
MFFRRDKSLPMDDFSDPLNYWSSVRKVTREKADHNKRESQSFFFSAIAFSLLVPLFIAFGSGEVWGKIVPAALSALVTAATSWLQLRQPQRLWTVYRRAQRELEHEKVLFDNALLDYGSSQEPQKLLVERTAEIAMRVHDQWEKLVPETSGLGNLINTDGK